MNNIVDLTGKKFGRLLVVEIHKPSLKNGVKKRWICKCDCGNITIHLGKDL